ncbi:hypothetical protein TVAGG3_0977250 [Trichomonas vaginalis G3]|uniref:hypothetical protein n=1 Tax=Trichomonas vaginalis (strain ATCC PRA-98 / G3) TaxID=412133 RepID=UPI0021E5FF68|nr:hypothetical protein TVAGG3_0977250 [Trichomonas vaginalis G3]KAI5489029.1 hypothetical protein TVAGG3_0977250 [Trichomonas vaginalis G3]
MIGPSTMLPNAFEKFQLSVGCYVQLAVKVKNNKVSEIVNEIYKKCIGCRTLFDGKNYVYTDQPCSTYQIPDKFPHLEEANKFVAKNYTIPESTRLASICYNKDTVIFNCNHSSSDGGYMKMLLDHLCGRETPKDPQAKIHTSIIDALSDQLANANGKISTMTTPIRNYCKKQEKEYAIYTLIEFPIKEKMSKVTEKMMLAATLSASAYNKMLTSITSQLAVDARRYMKNPDWSHCNIDSLIVADAHTNIATKYAKLTIDELGALLRKDMQEKLKNGEALRSINHLYKGTYPPAMTGSVSVTNIGKMTTGGDITDAQIATSICKGPYPPGGMSISSTLVNDIFRARIYTSPYITSFKEAEKFKNAVNYCIKELKPDMTVKEAFTNLTKIIHQ